MQQPYIPVSQWNKYYAWPTVGSLRWMVFKANQGEKTGFEHCLKRIGKRILIDTQLFFEWVDFTGFTPTQEQDGSDDTEDS
jgi:hypothetical protein